MSENFIEFIRVLKCLVWNRVTKFILITFTSGGWLFFFYFSGYFFILGLRREIACRVVPEIYGEYTFSKLWVTSISSDLFQIAFLWLALVVLVWTVIGFNWIERRQQTMNKYWKWVRLLGLIVFSGGWLWPLFKFAQYIGRFSIVELARRVAPEKYGPYIPSDFPYVQYLETMLQVACLWLAVVIGFWAVVIVRLSVRKKRATLETSG